MLLHEFQAKKLLRGFGISAPMGQVVASPTEAQEAAERLGCRRYAVKGQLLVNDRAAQDAIRYASTPAEVAEQARKLIGSSYQIAGGQIPDQVIQLVLVEEFVEAAREFYAAVSLDRAAGKVVLMASSQGGSGIEQRVKAAPQAIHRCELKLVGMKAVGDFAGTAEAVSPEPGLVMALAEVFRNLAVALVASDAMLVEINPLVVTADSQLVALDAKMIIDDNALYRRPELAALRIDNERLERDRNELEAQRYQMNFLSLDGEIGVAVNGAGLALATHDLIVDCGGRPSNFMDIRTTAKSLDIAHGFEMLLANPKTRAILVNVHGGGMQRCDTIAEGLGIALRRRSRKLPIVIRMAGNNADFARTVLRNNGVQFYQSETMEQAARQVVELCRKEAA
ncbi:MAG: acetate--CoA ligase family protein [Alphaproteobacteria bacterium]|nr:acetate--CoA ligase family protein [Alphaproteobacteria bacterium]